LECGGLPPLSMPPGVEGGQIIPPNPKISSKDLPASNVILTKHEIMKFAPEEA
jgi:hypothetical protein